MQEKQLKNSVVIIEVEFRAPNISHLVIMVSCHHGMVVLLFEKKSTRKKLNFVTLKVHKNPNVALVG